MTAEKRLLPPVLQLGGNGDFQKKNIEIIDAFFELLMFILYNIYLFIYSYTPS
jgi:hypothetical protein